MPSPATIPEFVGLVERSGVLEAGRLAAYLDRLRGGPGVPAEPPRLAGLLVRDGLLTHFQAEQFLQGRWKRFSIGKYKVLERIGAGGMGQVFLCEHKLMRRRVAVKVLPTAKAEEESALKRFYREARAVAALDHPNIVRAYDIDQDERLHFLVMEYVDGRSLQEIVKGHGPMAVAPACHYVSQAAVGIQYASDAAGLVHRDIKPGNILVDRQGTVKILDMGLARFFHDTEDNLTRMNDDQVLGTADYLAPEQAVESHSVDVRADVYSLGATFYFLLTGQPPFADGTITQKLIWHQKKDPRPVRELRPEVPAGVAAVLAKMMAKDPDGRYQAPAEVAAALAPWTAEPLDPPPAAWMPHLSPAAQPASGLKAPDANGMSSGARTPSPSSSSSRGPNTPRPAGSSETVVPLPRPARPPSPIRPLSARPPAPPPSPPPAKQSGLVELTPRAHGTADLAADWEALTAQTQNPAPSAETGPLPIRKASRVGRFISGVYSTGRALLSRVAWRRWLLIGGGALAVAVALAVVVWLLIRGNPGATGPDPKAESARTLLVATTGRDAFKTVLQAYLNARPGDLILVADDVHEERLTIRPGQMTIKKDVTIAAPAGKRVVWRAPAAARDRLLYLEGCDGLRLRGFDFEGDGLETVIHVAGRCEGLALEDLEVRGYSGSGVRLDGCEGTTNRPVTLDRVRVRQGAAPAGAKPGTARPVEALALFAVPAGASVPVSRHVVVQDCDLEGVQAVVRFAGPFSDVTLTGNRLSRGRVGLLFEAIDPPGRKAALGSLLVQNNRFAGVQTLAQVDALKSYEFDPRTPPPVKSAGNTSEGANTQGNLRIE